jgi:hypothetical protein
LFLPAYGIYEYILNDAGQITHQRFFAGGTYTGIDDLYIMFVLIYI